MLDPNINLPFYPDSILRGGVSQEEYLRDLTLAITTMYKDIADAFNGYLLYSNSAENSTSWIPTVSGESSAGSGTYSVRAGWGVRQGYLVDLFFDVHWTAHTGTGNLVVNLPFIVSLSQTTPKTSPFTGTACTSNIAYPSGYTYTTLQAISDTRTARLVACGSALPATNITLPSSGRIIGNLRYIGEMDEG